MIKAYQIYYDELQKDSLMDGFIPYFNKKAIVTLESGIICDLVNQGECSNCDWFGVFSWQVGDKITGFNFDRLKNAVVASGAYDILAPNPKNYWFDMLHHPHLIHEPQHEIRFPFHFLMERLLRNNLISERHDFTKPSFFVYCNYFLARKDVYVDYVNSFLKRVIELIKTDKELNDVMMQLIPYHDTTRIPCDKVKVAKDCIDWSGDTKTLPVLPFILERLINIYIRDRKVDVNWVL